MKPLFCVLAVVLVIASCNSGMNTNPNADQIAKNKAATQKFYNDLVNKHNASLVDSMFTSDFIDHSPDPGYAGTRDGMKKDFADLFKAFPDITTTVNVLTADSNFVTAEVTWVGTNTGIMDTTKPATGKQINIQGIDLFIFKDGKGTAHWGYYEDMKMMHQLGMLPEQLNSMWTDTSKTKQ